MVAFKYLILISVDFYKLLIWFLCVLLSLSFDLKDISYTQDRVNHIPKHLNVCQKSSAQHCILNSLVSIAKCCHTWPFVLHILHIWQYLIFNNSELYICTHHIKDVVHEWNKGPFLLFSIPSEKKRTERKGKKNFVKMHSWSVEKLLWKQV